MGQLELMYVWGMGTTVHCLLAEDWGFPGESAATPAAAGAPPAGRLAHTFSPELIYNRSSPKNCGGPN